MGIPANVFINILKFLTLRRRCAREGKSGGVRRDGREHTRGRLEGRLAERLVEGRLAERRVGRLLLGLSAPRRRSRGPLEPLGPLERVLPVGGEPDDAPVRGRGRVGVPAIPDASAPRDRRRVSSRRRGIPGEREADAAAQRKARQAVRERGVTMRVIRGGE